jgi:cysteine-rich repeat protein
MDPLSGNCDDGNNLDDDGCSSTCSIEPGWVCSGGTTTTLDTCSDLCGDGKVMVPSPTY